LANFAGLCSIPHLQHFAIKLRNFAHSQSDAFSSHTNWIFSSALKKKLSRKLELSIRAYTKAISSTKL
jgi:hypothetical protein